jgi:hypothetical protein
MWCYMHVELYVNIPQTAQIVAHTARRDGTKLFRMESRISVLTHAKYGCWRDMLVMMEEAARIRGRMVIAAARTRQMGDVEFAPPFFFGS